MFLLIINGKRVVRGRIFRDLRVAEKTARILQAYIGAKVSITRIQ